jgi:type IV pilus assembly protein PilC
MAKYAYVGTGSDGVVATGIERAASREAAELALHELKLRDVTLVEKKSLLRAELRAPRVKRDQVMNLTRQLGAFIRAGLPVVDAVRALGSEAKNTAVRRMMEQVEDGLRSGDMLSACFERHPKIFPEYYCGILRSAELTGKLDTVLDQLAKYLERDLEAKRRVKAALIYPVIIAIMSLVTVVVLSVFVLPGFKLFFASLHAQLPLPTRMLLSVTDFFTLWWWAMLLAVVALVLAYFAAMRIEAGRYARDRFFLAVPVLGGVIQFTLVERFCRILSSMVGAGVSLPVALRVATESLRSLVFVRALSSVGEAMLEGEGLAKPLADTGLFPSTAAQMMRVGEDTGTLDTQLEVTARYYEGELDYRLKKMTALFEPLVIVAMGAVVGFVAVALVSAMYGIFNQVQA